MRVIHGIALIMLVMGPVACFVPGEAGELGFELHLADALYEFRSGDRVLLGTKLCPRVEMATDDEGNQVRFMNAEEEATYLLPCMNESLSGGLQFDAERCLLLDTPGTLTWTLESTGECEWESDSLRFEVSAATAQLRAGFDDWRVRSQGELALGVEYPVEIVGLAPGRTIEDLYEDPAAPRLVAAGQLDTPMLRLDDELGRMWTGALPLTLVGEGATIIEAIEDEASYEYVAANELPLVLEPGAVVRIRASLPGGEQLDTPELIAVPPSAAASLDLVVAAVGEDGSNYAFAEVRDAEGRVIHGAPIEWSVQDGALSVIPGSLDNEARSGEYALVSLSDCEPPPAQPSERHAILRARVGELEDSVELEWTAMPEEPNLFDDLPFEPGPYCMFGDGEGGNDEVGEAGLDDGSGCGCTSSRETPPFASLALLGLLGLRRRRP